MRSPRTILMLLLAVLVVGNVWETYRRSGIPESLIGRVTGIAILHEKHPGLDDMPVVTVDDESFHLDPATVALLRLNDTIRKPAGSRTLTTPRGDVVLTPSRDCRRMRFAMPLVLALGVLLLLVGPRRSV